MTSKVLNLPNVSRDEILGIRLEELFPEEHLHFLQDWRAKLPTLLMINGGSYLQKEIQETWSILLLFTDRLWIYIKYVYKVRYGSPDFVKIFFIPYKFK